MSVKSWEDLLRGQWRALPRAARWKVIGGLCVVFASLTAQIFFVWLYNRVRDVTQPMLFSPSSPSLPASVERELLNIVFDNARHSLVINALALNIVLWATWSAWVLWRATRAQSKRPNIEYSKSPPVPGDAP